MPASTRRRITAKELQEDIDAFYALKLLTDYKPHDPNATVDAITPIVDRIRAKQEAIIASPSGRPGRHALRPQRRLPRTPRENGRSKNEVRAQYGDNSNQTASLGLKRNRNTDPAGRRR